MARRAVPHVLGGLYHLVSRGNDGQALFECEYDRMHCLDLMREGLDRHGLKLLAFSLMSNHVHQVVQVGNSEVGDYLHDLYMRYSKYVSHRYGHSGHLVQGHSFRRLLRTDADLLSTVRYVHLNPLRAGMCSVPEDHQWSSHRYYVDAVAPRWFDRSIVFSLMGETDHRTRFHSFVMDGADKSRLEGMPKPRGKRLGVPGRPPRPAGRIANDKPRLASDLGL